jgi:hypothetical protein
MLEHEPTQPLFLIVIDEDRGVFSVEGSMTDSRPWQSSARNARDQRRRVVCGPSGQIVTRLPQSSAASASWLASRREASLEQSADRYLNREAKKRPPQRTGAASDRRYPVERSGCFAACRTRSLVAVAIPFVGLLHPHHFVRDTDRCCSYPN